MTRRVRNGRINVLKVRKRRLRRAGGAVAALLVLATLPVLVVQSSSAADVRLADGSSAATAAGSCWEIKQNNASAPDGVYWLVTPALQAPQQFYCDQTTDGGGWELVARGREGWKPYYNGIGSAANLRSTVTGPAAFSPAQLPAQTVDGLLNNTNVNSLPDGIRLRRATNTAGTSWQEARFAMTQRTRWAWTFAALHPVGAFKFDNSSGSGGQTSNFGSDQSFRRVLTSATQAQGFLWGFAFGNNVGGTNDPNSYIWSFANGLGNGRPFTQMFIRPKLFRDAMYGGVSVPASGTAKQEVRAEPQSDAQKTVWGVNGLQDGIDSEQHVEVGAFAQVGSTVFVGGNFKNVQQDAAGTGQIAQADLAGFDVNTSQPVTTFKPTFNAQVRALAALPDGRLAVGGEFTTVDGVAQSGLAFLDPTTGALSGPQVQVQNRSAGATVGVRGLTVRNGYLYLSGAFTHTVQGTTTAADWNGARVNLTSTTPDTHWNPTINGATVGVDASAQNDRVYYAGYFTTIQNQNAPHVNAVAPTAGAALAMPGFVPKFSTTDPAAQWQFGVRETGGKFYYGGSQHLLAGYDRASLTQTSGSVTSPGGDIQSIWTNDPYNMVFAGCHCGDFNYDGTSNWPTPTGASQADSINLFGGWDAATGAYLPEFNPIVTGRKGYGVWALFTDSRGVVWAGGDLKSSVRAGYTNQWSGGFARFAPRDNLAPTVPTNLSSTNVDAGSFKLSWTGSTDGAAAAPTYEVLEDNRVIGTSSTTSLVVHRLSDTHRYFVRAVDAAGNRSASTSALSVAGGGAVPPPPSAPVVTAAAASPTSVHLSWPAETADGGFTISRDGTKVGTAPSGATSYDDNGVNPSTTYTYVVTATDTFGQQTPSAPAQATTPTQTTFVAKNANWHWRFAATAPDAAWTGASYDDSTWSTGVAPLGFGTALATTDISVGAPSPRPLSAQFRTTFVVPDVTKVGSSTLTFVADDGVVVYVNGVEVSRVNMPAGTITNNTYATAAPGSTAANNTPTVINIPATALKNGTNVIAAETHVNYRTTPNALFRASLTSP